MAVTAAELQAVLGVDSSQATQELNSFDRGLRGIAARGGRLTGSLGKVNKGMKRIGGTARGLVTATIAMAGLDAGVGLLGDSIIGLNSTLEKSEIQFATLMGDADKAKKHVDSLFQFAKKTPFETEPIIQASKYLQQFGGEALNTTKNLTLVGDASAATGAEFSDLSMWVGRMYGNLQAGKPVGEAMARLQELGVITPKVRLKIEKMQKAGKKSGVIWGYLQKQLGKYGGAMEKQSKTWEGLTSTLIDTVQLTLAKAFRPLFEGMKAGLDAVISFLSDPAIEEGLTAIGTAVMQGIGFAIDIIGKGIEWLMPIIQAILGVAGPIIDLFDAFMRTGGAVGFLGTYAERAGSALSNLASTVLGKVWEAVTSLGGILLSAGKKLGGWVLQAIPGVVAGLATWSEKVLTKVGEVADTLFGEGGKFGEFVDGFSGWVGTAIDTMTEKLPEYLTAIIDWIVGAAPTIGENIASFIVEFTDWVITAGENILPNLANFLSTIITWVSTEGIPGIINAASGFAQGFIDGIMSGLAGTGSDEMMSMNPADIIAIDGGGGLGGRIQSFFTDTVIPAIQTVGETLVAEGLSLAGQFVKGYIEGMVNLPAAIIGWFLNDFPGLVADAWTSLTTEGENGGASMIDGFITKLGELPGEFLTWVTTDAIPGISEWLSTFNLEGLDGAKEFIAGFIDKLDEMPGKVLGGLRTVARNILDYAPVFAARGLQLARQMFTGFMDVVLGRNGHAGFIQAGKDIISKVIQGLNSKLASLLTTAINLAKKLWNAFANWFNKHNQFTLSIDLGVIADAANAILDLPFVNGTPISRSISGTIGLPDLPTYGAGAWNIPTDQIAMLHQGEAVLPANVARELRSMFASGRGPGSGDVMVHIENFYGTEENVRRLSRELGRAVRTGSVASYSGGTRSAA